MPVQHAAVAALLDVHLWLIPEAERPAAGPVTRRAASVTQAPPTQPLPPALQAPSVAAVRFAACCDAMASIAQPILAGSTPANPPATPGDPRRRAAATPPLHPPATNRIVALDGPSPIIFRVETPVVPHGPAPGPEAGTPAWASTGGASRATATPSLRRGHTEEVTIPLERGSARMAMHAAASVILCSRRSLKAAVTAAPRAAQALRTGAVAAVDGVEEWKCASNSAMHAAVVLDVFETCQDSFLDFLGVRRL